MDPYDAPRTCPKCKHKDAIPAGDKRLSCLLCREKAKERQRKYRIKEREAVVKQFENESGGTATTIKPLKRKRDPPTEEYQYYQSADGQFENESDGNATTAIKPLKKKRELPTEEYQSADGLYKALRTILRDATSSAGHRLPSFHGCFSIVIDPSVDHLDRARAVTKDLKKIVKYPFANVGRDPTSNGHKFARIVADCQCLALVSMAGSSSSSSTSSPVLHQLNSVASGNKFVEALEASFERNCGGKVRISVKGDFSHPLGISGQKVTIKIVH